MGINAVLHGRLCKLLCKRVERRLDQRIHRGDRFLKIDETDGIDMPAIRNPGNIIPNRKRQNSSDGGRTAAAFFLLRISEAQNRKIPQYVERDADSFATPEFPDNWMHAGGEGSESFSMTICCRDLLLIYKDSGDRRFGAAEALVGGVEPADVRLDDNKKYTQSLLMEVINATLKKAAIE